MLHNLDAAPAEGYLVWWMSDEESDRLDDLLYARGDEEPSWPAAVPTYIQEQFDDRLGRAGRGRIWSAEGMPTSAQVPPCAQESGGIVVRSCDRAALAGLPGILATLEGRVLEGALQEHHDE